MFPFQLLLALAADTLAVDLDAWVPGRLATVHAVAIGVAVVTDRETRREWYRGVDNVLTRTPVSPETSWPVRAFSSASASTASPHSHFGDALLPGLITLAVWSALAWVLLIPVSSLVHHEWRLGRWHEILAILLALPITWIFLRRLAGPVMASYFTSISGVVLLVPVAVAAGAWRKSRAAALAMMTVAALVTWTARSLPVPLPLNFDGGPSEGASLRDLEDAALQAMAADSLGRTAMGFRHEGDRWSAHDRSRGAEALLVLLSSREMGVIVVSNTGETAGLLQEIVDSIAR